VKIRWSPAATALARRYLRDQNGMRAIGVAVAALARDPYPPEGFHRAGITASASADTGFFTW
jgi:hypothetical protein